MINSMKWNFHGRMFFLSFSQQIALLKSSLCLFVWARIRIPLLSLSCQSKNNFLSFSLYL